MSEKISKEQFMFLMEQHQNATKGFLEVFLQTVEERLSSLQVMVCEVKASLEFTQAEVVDIKKDVSKCKDTIKSLSGTTETITNIGNRVRIIEDEIRKNNVRIDGLSDDLTETSEQTQVRVQNFLKEKLDINASLNNAFRLNKKKDYKPSFFRTIIATLPTFTERTNILHRKSKLKKQQRLY